jgi:AraC-like DNA-binding protein
MLQRLLDERTLGRLARCPRALEALRLARCSLPSVVHAGAIAAQLGMRPPTLSRLFAKHLGLSFKRTVQLLRIEIALTELERADCGLTHLAEISGYGSARTLSRSFKAVLGVTPSEFRRNLLSAGLSGWCSARC